jgi:hypothetical protein
MPTLDYRICYTHGVDEWDIYQTDEVATWLRDLQESLPKTADLVDNAIYTLSGSGPALGRPLVDTITNSKIANLKRAPTRFPRAQRGPYPVRLRPVALRNPARRWRQGGELEQVVRTDDPSCRAAL